MKRTLIGTILILAVTLTATGSLSCSPGIQAGKAESLIIGTMANAGDTLIFTAEEQGYFAANGLDVTLKTYANGLAATNAMLEGEVDLAYATEFVIVGKALGKEKISIITTYSKNNTVSLAGRKDLGIKNVSDLKDKKVGLGRGTISEFYLGRLLDLNGLSIGDIILVDIKVAELANAFISGDVDAIVAGSRHLLPVIQQQGNNVFVWPAHSDRPAYGTLVGKNDWIARNAEPVKRLLKALSEAEQYVYREPDKARAAVQKILGFDDAYMADVWSEYQFSLSLDQSLITAMEDEARWMIANNLTTERQMPNFLDYIYESHLKAIKPETVNIIR